MYRTAVIILAVLLLGYCLLILLYRKWFLQLPVFRAAEGVAPQHFFSVIIPARNEQHAIETCIRSVLEQDYPQQLIELIVINDHSTDNTENIIRRWQAAYSNLRLINLAEIRFEGTLNSYKKKAIELAISQSKGDWIVTTDADCEAPSQWLRNIDAFIQATQPVFVAAPVMFRNTGGFLSIFQVLDFMSLQGITAASVGAGYHSMCNGANIAYEKKAFSAVNGFRGIDQIASGDDMLLMHKIKQQYPGRLGYLFSRDAIVRTDPMPTWKTFFSQRIRWASKADKYNDRSVFWVLALVYALNVVFVILLLAGLFTGKGLINWLLPAIVKIIVELSFMVPVAVFFRQTDVLPWFPIMQPFHMVYTVIAGWLGKFGTYQWKGRKVK